MMFEPIEVGSRSRRTFSAAGRILGALKLDGPLLVGLGLITLFGLVVLYSASGQNWNTVFNGDDPRRARRRRHVRAGAGEAGVPAPPRACRCGAWA